ncbi:MAG: nitroreductase family protein, partial [bacterium]
MAKKNKIYPDDLLNLIKDRRTIRKYQDKNIPKKILDSIIEAGCWAPSTHNSQPWFYLVIKNSTI